MAGSTIRGRRDVGAAVARALHREQDRLGAAGRHRAHRGRPGRRGGRTRSRRARSPSAAATGRPSGRARWRRRRRRRPRARRGRSPGRRSRRRRPACGRRGPAGRRPAGPRAARGGQRTDRLLPRPSAAATSAASRVYCRSHQRLSRVRAAGSDREAEGDRGERRVGLADVAALARQVAAEREHHGEDRRAEGQAEGLAGRPDARVDAGAVLAGPRGVDRRGVGQHRHREDLAPGVADAHQRRSRRSPHVVARPRASTASAAPAASTSGRDRRSRCFLPTRVPDRAHSGVSSSAGPTKQTKRTVAAPVLPSRSSAR